MPNKTKDNKIGKCRPGEKMLWFFDPQVEVGEDKKKAKEVESSLGHQLEVAPKRQSSEGVGDFENYIGISMIPGGAHPFSITHIVKNPFELSNQGDEKDANKKLFKIDLGNEEHPKQGRSCNDQSLIAKQKGDPRKKTKG